jgi:hypothetical protein
MSRPMGYIFPKKIQAAMNGELTEIRVGGFHKKNMEKNREVGEKWTDDNGIEWEQKNGYKLKVTKLDDAKPALFCPECNKILNKRLDGKFMLKKNKCFDCVVKEENEMRINGTYDSYEKELMTKNAISFFLEAKQGVEEYIEDIKNKEYIEYVESDGHIEKWEFDKEAMIEFFEKELTEINKNLEKLHKGEFFNEQSTEKQIEESTENVG